MDILYLSKEFMSMKGLHRADAYIVRKKPLLMCAMKMEMCGNKSSLTTNELLPVHAAYKAESCSPIFIYFFIIIAF